MPFFAVAQIKPIISPLLCQWDLKCTDCILCGGKDSIPLIKEYSEYEMKLHLIRFHFGALGNVEYLFISSMLPLNYCGSTYLGPIYGLNRPVWKLFVLDWNTWNHKTISYFLLRATWSYNYLLRIIISHSKPYNCAQTNDY